MSNTDVQNKIAFAIAGFPATLAAEDCWYST